MYTRELTAAELDALSLVTPCTCLNREPGQLGGHYVECAVLVATHLALAARDKEWQILHPPVFTPIHLLGISPEL